MPAFASLPTDMYETIPVAEGVAVAAPQVGVTRRLIVIRYIEYDEEDEDDEGEEITLPAGQPGGHSRAWQSGRSRRLPEHPGLGRRGAPLESITVKAIDMDNKSVRIKATGYLARIFQHEIDHLDGILFTDRVVDKETLRFVGTDDDE